MGLYVKFYHVFKAPPPPPTPPTPLHPKLHFLIMKVLGLYITPKKLKTSQKMSGQTVKMPRNESKNKISPEN